MTKKTSQTLFRTGTLMAISLGINQAHAESLEKTETFETSPVDHSSHAHHAMEGMCGSDMRMDAEGMVMFENTDRLPKECEEISEEVKIEVRAGVKYSKPYPGTVFGYDQHVWHAKPCSKVTVTFTNDDEIRHQWMIHGLPRYLYPKGMFHIEVNGGASKTGSFIVNSSHYTYLVHCDIAQHMEKGMKAQLVVGKGRGDLKSIPGVSEAKFPDKF